MKRLGRKTAILIILAIVLSLSVVVAAVTYAAYTDSQHAQRTIANYEPNGDRFRSNALDKTAAKDNIVKIYTTETANDDPAIMRISVSNYEKITFPFNSDILYTLTAELVRYDETEKDYVPFNLSVPADVTALKALTAYTVDIKKDGDVSPTELRISFDGDTFTGKLSHTFSDPEQKLTGGTADTDIFILTMSENFAASSPTPNLYVKIVAEPDESTALPTLAGIFKAEYHVEGAKNTWTGSFHDDTSSAPSSYDGFNYRITGVGKANVTLTWDTTQVTMSYVSLKTLLAIEGVDFDDDSTVYEITFPVDSDIAGVYDLQFYKAAGSVWTDVVWNTEENKTAMNGEVVTFNYSVTGGGS